MLDNNPTRFRRTKTGIVCAGLFAVAAFFLLTGHTAHLLGALPWPLLAACPLMHLFMHHRGAHDPRAYSAKHHGDSSESARERMHVRPAHTEARAALSEFGRADERCAAATPRWRPRFGHHDSAGYPRE